MPATSTKVRGVLPAIVTDYALTHLGFFVVMPILPLLLGAAFASESATWTGVALGAMAFAMRGGSLFVSGWMHRSSVRASVLVGLLLAAAGFVVTAAATQPLIVTLALSAAGLGFSMNGIASRGYVALRVPDKADQNTVFGVIQVVVNVAAAIGPILANLLLGRQAFAWALLGTAALLGLAALVVPLLIPADSHLAEGATRPPLKIRLLVDLVTDRGLRRISVVVLGGGVLYGQFFSSLAVMINRSTEEPLLRAGFYTVNAVLVVVAQLPVTALVNRLMTRVARPIDVLVAGICLFGAAFGLVAAGGGSLLFAYLAITVFSLGETLYTPMVNTAFLDAAHGRPVVEAFNLRQVATAVGESLGALAGGWLYLEAIARGLEDRYWSVLALTAVLTLPFLLRRSPHGRVAAE